MQTTRRHPGAVVPALDHREVPDSLEFAMIGGMFRGALGAFLIALAGCGSNDPAGDGPPPLPTSSVTSKDAGYEAAPVDAGPQSVIWSGSLAKTNKVAFGGDPYCNYEVVLTNVKVDLTLSSDRTIASGAVTWTMTETTIPPCLYTPQAPSQNSASPAPAKTMPLANGGFHVELLGAPDNHPEGTLVLESNAGGESTIEWKRTDQTGKLGWTVRATIPLLKK